MSNPVKHESAPSHGGYERQDIGARGIFYFLAGLLAATLLIAFLLSGLYRILDQRFRTHQPPVNPLAANVPQDTRQVPPQYPQTAFPDPRLETDERTQLNSIRIAEEQKLNSYGWVDEKAGTVHIPIERAMELLAERGLPLHPPSAAQPQNQAPKKQAAKPATKKEKKGKKQ
jgi:hypothetical protein